MKARLPLLCVALLWLPLLACQRLSNKLDTAALECGDDVRQFPGSRFISPDLTVSAESWQGVGQTPAGFKALPKSSRGCLIVDQDVSGPLFLRHQTLELGASLSTSDWTESSVQQLKPLPTAPGLVSERLTLSCGKGLTNQFAAPFQLQSQASAQLHLYRLRYDVLDREGRVLIFGETAVNPGGPHEVELPKVLADGAFELRWTLYDVFENLYTGVSVEAQSCPLQLDTKSPEVGGFRETLPQLSDQLRSYQEVSPGQALNLEVNDAASTQIFFCLYALGEAPCETFTQLSGPLYAPDEGAWTLRYYAVDEAGNRSPAAELPPLAVMHRDVMKSIDSRLALARLETERNQFLEANKQLLEAYRAYYSLKLPLEREPLSAQLGLTFSEVARSQHLLAELRDHAEAIKQFEWLGADQSAFASLDNSGVLTVRGLEGQQLQRLEEVAAFAPSFEHSILLLFRDGSYQLGLEGSRRKLPRDLKPQLLALSGSEVLVADSKRFALLELQSDKTLTLRWEKKLKTAPESILLGQRDRLAIAASPKQILSFDSQSGRPMQSSSWDARCSFSLAVEAPGYGWFIGLRTDNEAGLSSNEEFHCELLRWDARSVATRVAHEKVLDPNDPFHKPEAYRFEEVNEISYSAARGWLAFSRSLGDPSFVVYDLKKNFALVYENAGDPNQSLGEVSTLGFSADGRFFAVSQSQQLSATVWDLGSEPELDPVAYSWQDPLLTIKGQPRVVEKLLIHSQRPWLLTADEGRRTRIYNFQTTLLPRFSSELSPGPLGQGDSQNQIVQLKGERLDVFDPYGQALFSTSRPGQDLRAVVALDPKARDSGLLALDRSGQLWETAARPDSWQLAYAAPEGSSCDSLVPSPSRLKLLITCQDANRQSFLVLLTRAASQDAWTEALRLNVEARRLAWNPNESSFSTLSRKSASLWSLEGQILIEQTGEKVLGSEAYLPFSANGKRWLSHIDSTVSVWDIDSRTLVQPSWTWAQPLGFVSFASSRSDRIWLAARSSGRGESLVEVDEGGQITRNFGEFPGSVRLIFQNPAEPVPWGFDNEGRLFRLNEARVGPTALISIKEGDGEIPLALNQQEQFLLTQDNRSRLGVLFLDEDRRQLKELCSWLSPMLRAGSDPGFGAFASFCQAEMAPPPSAE